MSVALTHPITQTYSGAITGAAVAAKTLTAKAAFADGLVYYVPEKVYATYADPNVVMYRMVKRTVSWYTLLIDQILFNDAFNAKAAYTTV